MAIRSGASSASSGRPAGVVAGHPPPAAAQLTALRAEGSVGGVETTFEHRVCDGIAEARSSRVVFALALVAEHRLVMNERVTSPLLSPSPRSDGWRRL